MKHDYSPTSFTQLTPDTSWKSTEVTATLCDTITGRRRQEMTSVKPHVLRKIFVTSNMEQNYSKTILLKPKTHTLYYSVYSRCYVTAARQTNIRPLLSNGLINTFPWQRIRTQQQTYCCKRGALYVVRAEMLCAGQFEATSSVELCKGCWGQTAL
jgi:hypothetical protein